MSILVTGGAGYIGSATVDLLLERGEPVVVLDNFVEGHRDAIHGDADLYEGSIGDTGLVTSIVRKHEVQACIHFAAHTNVGVSVTDPGRFYANNVGEGLALMNALREAGVKHVVFSSTCATYGEPVRIPMDEDHPQNPHNPYGWTKFFMERILEDFDRAYGMRFVGLRYFNASGATRLRGEHHRPETHLIPLVLFTALAQRESISVFGSDYGTHDGSCVRDYIHIADLAEAHWKALAYLRADGKSDFFNVGTGRGYSVFEVIEAARKISGRPISVKVEDRRPGDASYLVADATKAKQVLGWEPEFDTIESIIESAWRWHEAHPEGYAR
ncbi:MAG: UDP-glucose 4-epimerase GalE [Bryobacterales bacterium]|jgi:UDP-glucose 4-epimerase|nr:UDP-glucose 4-epimerase GalE [Bryobacterales bacterium]